MTKRRDERDEYVVELLCEAIAVLTVHADSPAQALAAAELQVKVADVSELHDVVSLRVVRVGDDPPEAVARELAETPVAASEEPGHGGTE